MPPGWTVLSDDDRQRYWSAFELKFGEFRPGVEAENWPAISEPVPSLTFDLSVTTPSPAWAARFDALNAEALRCFVEEFADAEWVVLDWQHDGYRFDPARHAGAFGARWEVSVYPDGDYYLFARPDLSEGTFGHPWEQTLCVFGSRLIGTLGRTLSTWLPLKRVDGQPLSSWS
ncbi:hypothetical protein GOEFS_077_00560 [Gordonia effusa NBRC 100432]|uniref:DUF2716 domain-containing protein n=2 Tax=Gordonia effusa TaxID=263908 RepID=H0R2G3_9ACTN|nr:hypothetical protein GOEFS_077_00560 [Gordonia effusa NBRC 100432]